MDMHVTSAVSKYFMLSSPTQKKAIIEPYQFMLSM